MASGDPTDQRVQLFISYNRADADWVKGTLEEALRSSGVTFRTRDDIEPGVPVLKALEREVKAANWVVIVVTPAYLVDDSDDFVVLLGQAFGKETGTWPVLPLLHGVDDQPLPLLLGMLQPLRATTTEEAEDAFARLAKAAGRPLAQPSPPPAAPYPGMRAYGEQEAATFRGRTAITDDLVRRLRVERLICLIGPSGSGKSSLINAGLIPSLKSSKAFGPGTWTVRFVRPGDGPAALALPGPGNDERRLLIVDQFEETFAAEAASSSDFQKALLLAFDAPSTWVVVAVRADFFAELMSAPIWARIAGHQFPLAPLNDDELAAAIVEPAEASGVYVEPALVERIVADAAGEPGILPFLQETMLLLWDHLERRFLPLRAYETLVLPRSAYTAIGGEEVTGLHAAIALHAEAVWTDLPADQCDVARRTFVRLVQFGEGRPDTRRRQAVEQLRGREDPTAYDAVLMTLAGDTERLLTLSGSETGERFVDLAHESMISAWPRFRGWIKDYRKAEEIRREIESFEKRWRETRDGSYLYEGAQLRDAGEWKKNYPTDADPEVDRFLAASGRRARRRWLAKVVLASLVTALAFAGVGAGAVWARGLALNLSARGESVRLPDVQARLGSGPSPDLRTYRGPDVVVRVAAVSIDRFEVTNRQYRLCIDAGACTPPQAPAGSARYDDEDQQLPVVWVTAAQAHRFCTWLGRRLPTETEWERAARGAEGRPWPWGDAPPTTARANVGIESANYTSPGRVAVGDPAFTSGQTPEGIAHLLGNVSEWTSTPTDCAAYACDREWDGARPVLSLVTRGLSYKGHLSADQEGPDAHAVLGEFGNPGAFIASEDVGFRCAGG